MFDWDPWQERVLDHEGNMVLCTGRQVGKSTVISQKSHDFSIKHPESTTLCISASVRQSGFIFEKITAIFEGENEILITKAIDEFQSKNRRRPSWTELKRIQYNHSLYKRPPTKTKIELKNGSKIYSLPAGRTGVFIMGLTIDLLIADEAAFIPEPVWNAVLPMIAVARKLKGLGHIIMLSIPLGKGGYFYNSYHDKDFLSISVSSEDCIRIDHKFLTKERSRLSKNDYARIYLGKFVDDWNQFFPTNLIQKCMSFIDWNFRRDYSVKHRYYLGVDIARYGADESAFVIAEMDRTNKIRIVKALTTQKMPLTDTVGRILKLHAKFRFSKIFIDDAGIGAGPTDMLIERLGKRIVGMNNRRRSIEDPLVTGKLLKEDMYSNALMMMESEKLEMISDLGLLRSLKSIVYEYGENKNVRLYGDYDHICEAFVRACWSIKEKGLRCYIA